VLITDGQVGNEDQILKTLAPYAGKLRIFTLGIDRAVNAAFLRRLADLGGGVSEVVESEQRLDEVMDQIHRNVGTPVLTGLTLAGSGLDLIAGATAPSRLPDLFVGSPVVIAGRYRGSAGGGLVLRATDAHGEKWAGEAPARLDDKAPLEKVWGRGRVRELEDRYAAGERQLEREVVATSLRCGLLSRFTAYVAVDRAEVVNKGGETKKVTQAVESPSGWGEAETQMAQAAMPADATRAVFGLGSSRSIHDKLGRVGGAPPAPAMPVAEPFPLGAEPIMAEALPMAMAEPMCAAELTPMPALDLAQPIAPAAPPPAAAPAAPAPPSAAPAAPLPAGAQPMLVVLRGQKRNVTYVLCDGRNFIGRADEKPVDVDLEEQELPDRIWCARQHACIEFENNQLAIEDLNSANGTYVNRTRVYPGQKRPLAVGDLVQVGAVQMKVMAAPREARQPAPAELRARADSLRLRLEAGGDPAVLKAMLPELRGLVRDLLEAGQSAGPLTSLVQHVRDLDQRLDAAAPAADQVRAAYQGVVGALREWLGVKEEPPASGGRAFWK
jgi:hypothetical protein